MQSDKVESPFEIPILSLKGVQKGTEIDGSMADGTTASVHFDLPLVSHCCLSVDAFKTPPLLSANRTPPAKSPITV